VESGGIAVGEEWGGVGFVRADSWCGPEVWGVDLQMMDSSLISLPRTAFVLLYLFNSSYGAQASVIHF